MKVCLFTADVFTNVFILSHCLLQKLSVPILLCLAIFFQLVLFLGLLALLRLHTQVQPTLQPVTLSSDAFATDCPHTLNRLPPNSAHMLFLEREEKSDEITFS